MADVVQASSFLKKYKKFLNVNFDSFDMTTFSASLHPPFAKENNMHMYFFFSTQQADNNYIILIGLKATDVEL